MGLLTKEKTTRYEGSERNSYTNNSKIEAHKLENKGS